MTEYSLTQLARTVAEVLGLPAPAQAASPAIGEIVAELHGAERLAVLAPDALGMHPFSLWRHEMPFLDSLHRQRSLVLRGVMPTITPVNFAAMVTGTDLQGHGIQTFNHDFTCETLFDVVRAHGGKSLGAGQKGYTGSELLGRNADFWGKADSNTDAEVEQIVLGLVREHRPRFVIVQFGSTDDVLHKWGPSSPEVVPMLQETDGRLRRVVAELLPRGYAVIITADHGQHDCFDGPGGTHGLEMDEDALVPCTWMAAEGPNAPEAARP